jgi:hypothetical protein
MSWGDLHGEVPESSRYRSSVLHPAGQQEVKSVPAPASRRHQLRGLLQHGQVRAVALCRTRQAQAAERRRDAPIEAACSRWPKAFLTPTRTAGATCAQASPSGRSAPPKPLAVVFIRTARGAHLGALAAGYAAEAAMVGEGVETASSNRGARSRSRRPLHLPHTATSRRQDELPRSITMASLVSPEPARFRCQTGRRHAERAASSAGGRRVLLTGGLSGQWLESRSSRMVLRYFAAAVL